MEQELANLDSTMERIKAFTKLALSSEPELVFAMWKAEFYSRLEHSKPNLIPLIYSCNDVLQESVKIPEKSAEFTRLFSPLGSLREFLPLVIKSRPDLVKNVQKVIGIWRDRRIFPADHLDALSKHLLHKDEDEDEDDEVNSSAEEVEVKKNSDDDDDEEEDEPAPLEDAREVQRKRLCQMSNAQLFALSHEIDSELAKKFQLENTKLERECDELTAEYSTSKDIEFGIEDVKRHIELLKCRRFAIQAKPVVKSALTAGLGKSIQQVEDGMHRAESHLEQTKALSSVLERGELTSTRALEGKYKSVRLIPKREKQVQQLVSSGPALTLEDNFTGITAEDAAKSNRPMMWHKGLRMYVPLPSGSDADNWRD
ncbi:hypothetical protein BASA82_000060 [Batrachochytrium salamandrivorans]|nr:hypothetical protein BASA82_000060 [Batrachochytrium salamandrivorans]